MKRILFFLLVYLPLLFGGSTRAQPGQSNAELARQYFSTGEYDKALVYFDKYYDQDPFGAYPAYLQSCLKTENYERAEKLIKKHIRKFPQDANAKIDLGLLYESIGKNSEAEKLYRDYVKSLPADINTISNLANAFIKNEKFDWAEQTYSQGRKNVKDAYPFAFERAELYSRQGKSAEMIEAYMAALEYSPSYLSNVQAVLQNRIANDTEGVLADQVRTSLLRKIQKEPEQTIYSELLYWLFLQERDYESALIQAKSLDKRLGEDGERLLTLGRLCVSNKEWVVAEDCFRAITTKGSTSPLYTSARIELINAANSRVVQSGKYTSADLLRLEKDYTDALAELGYTMNSAPLIRGYAHLQAFYLRQPEKARKLIEDNLEIPNLKPGVKAEMKLELGDICVFTGDVWEAALLYGQVDKDFKNDILGREAKYRRARLSYYMGEFDWAKDQLNVLKASTSQLISNDALSLALLITDNTNMDTSTTALMMYSRADLMNFRNEDSLAFLVLDTILSEFPSHSLTDEVWFLKSKMYLKQGKASSAAEWLQKILDQYPTDILGDDALITLAGLYEGPLADKEKARILYEKFLEQYPGSLFIADARRKYRNLRGDKVN